MIISFCIPCHKRLYDLRKALPSVIKAANNSPPVEIVIVNYNSGDGLEKYLFDELDEPITIGNSIRHVKYSDRDYYHNAHARNLCTLWSSGEYFVAAGTDRMLRKEFFNAIRDEIKKGAIWVQPSNKRRFIGVIACQRQEFFDAGGYDERFEFYGSEDKDLWDRLERRGKKFGIYDSSLQSGIKTPKSEKKKNYRKPVTISISRRQQKIYFKNISDGVLVANKDGWGKGIVKIRIKGGKELAS